MEKRVSEVTKVWNLYYLETAELESALDKAIALIVNDGADDFWCPQAVKYGDRILDPSEQLDDYNEANEWLYPECKHCCNETDQPSDVVTACYKRWFMSKESDKGET